MRWGGWLGVVGLWWGLLGLSACAVLPEAMVQTPRPSSSQANPPTKPFLRIETGMHTIEPGGELKPPFKGWQAI